MEVDTSTLNRNLPAELWREIFEKVPKKERQNIPQVNSFFYKIICDMEAFELELIFTQENLNEGIEMLLWSKRKIKKINFQNIQFNAENFALMIELLEVHGQTIENMEISNGENSVETTISFCLLIKFFQLTPKLKILTWSVRNVKLTNHFDENVLPRLKKLVLTCSDDLAFGFATMFTPGTIEELTVNSNWIHLDNLVSRQTSIKMLTTTLKLHNVEIFNCLKLEYLSVRSRIDAQKLMKYHPELEIVDISDGMITSLKTFQAFCKLEFLKSINIVVGEQTINEIHRISKLTNLTKVSFLLKNVGDSAHFLQVTTTKLHNVEVVEITDPNFTIISDLLLLETAGISWPKVKVLDIDVPTSFDGGILHLNEYFDNFKKLEKLKINCNDADLFEMTEDVDMRGRLHQNTCIFLSYFQQYPNIKWLEIQDANITHFCDLLSALPNLGYLEVKYGYGIDYTPRCLQELSQMKKLEVVNLKFSAISCKNFSEKEAALLKKLCYRLHQFGIEFVGFSDFYTTLRNQIRDCDFIEAELVENEVEDELVVGEDQNGHLKLSKVEY